MSEENKRPQSKLCALATRDIKINLSPQTKKKLIILAVTVCALFAVSFLRYRIYINLRGDLSTRILNIIYRIVETGITISAMRISGMEIKPVFRFRGARQYVFGVISGLVILFIIAVVPTFFGTSLIGHHAETALGDYIFCFFNYFFLVAPVEELIYRVFVQDTLTDILPKAKWLGVVAAAGIFGLAHIIAGTWYQVRITAILGLVWGFMRYFSKDRAFFSTVVSHGLYDFGLILALQFVIK